eukprot:scaffold2556_cov153-Skeletonema_menzelii.AAC.13
MLTNSAAKSLSSLTLRLLNLDDIGIGELANVLKRKDCNMRRLDLAGNFGNNGIKILAEALKTNQSIKTITLGCHKNLNDVGAQALLRVVDPFSNTTNANKKAEWDDVKKSNHSLQSVYILDRPAVTVSDELVTKLRSISSLQPHETFQTKTWHHIEKNIADISHMGVDNKYVPEVLSFVQKQGELNGLFETIRSSNSLKIFENPSPERARLSDQMDRIQKENAILKRLLKAERERSQSLREENYSVRKTVEMKIGKKCSSWNSCKQLWLEVVDLIKEPERLGIHMNPLEKCPNVELNDARLDFDDWINAGLSSCLFRSEAAPPVVKLGKTERSASTISVLYDT